MRHRLLTAGRLVEARRQLRRSLVRHPRRRHQHMGTVRRERHRHGAHGRRRRKRTHAAPNLSLAPFDRWRGPWRQLVLDQRQPARRHGPGCVSRGQFRVAPARRASTHSPPGKDVGEPQGRVLIDDVGQAAAAAGSVVLLALGFLLGALLALAVLVLALSARQSTRRRRQARLTALHST